MRLLSSRSRPPQPDLPASSEIAKHDPNLHADETTRKVQRKGECLRGWIWALLSRQAIANVFSESRSGAVADDLLAGTEGFLVIDGYAGYNGVVGNGGRPRVGCWGHARRRFWQAMNSVPEAREVRT